MFSLSLSLLLDPLSLSLSLHLFPFPVQYQLPLSPTQWLPHYTAVHCHAVFITQMVQSRYGVRILITSHKIPKKHTNFETHDRWYIHISAHSLTPQPMLTLHTVTMGPKCVPGVT